MMQGIADRWGGILDRLKGQAKVREGNIRDAIREIKLSLLEADVNYQVVKAFVDGVEKKALGTDVLESLTPNQMFVSILKDELVGVMGGALSPLDWNRPAPVVILMVGLQGSGKTTSSAKLARRLKGLDRRSPLLVPADPHRPAAIDQLQVLGRLIGIPVLDTSPKEKIRDVLRRASELAVRYGYDTLIIDSAGRTVINEELMSEIVGIKKALPPQETFLVADAMTGQDAVRVAKSFHERLGLTGVILTKMDGDARGGAALSIRWVTGCPLRFIGVGEKLDQFEPFDPDRVARRILGMGDILALVEKVQSSVTAREMEETAALAGKGELTVELFLSQLKMVKRMGKLGPMLGLLPGMSKLKDQINPDDIERHLKRSEAIINSMTKEERRDLDVLNGRRRQRIAKGSGVRVEDVNRFVKEFEEMKKMMKRFKRFGMKFDYRNLGRVE